MRAQPLRTQSNDQTWRSATRPFFLGLAGAVLLFALAAKPCRAQSQEVPINQGTRSMLANADQHESPFTQENRLRVKVDLVLVPVTVTDYAGRLITGLDKENFQIIEDKEKQDVKQVSNEDAPISLGIIFDSSGSMANKMLLARAAIVAFLDAANARDEFFIITFADGPQEASDFTNSPEEIESRLAFSTPKGRTALLDAIYLGLIRMRHARYARKALLIVSDGGDNHSRYTEAEIKSMIQESDTMIYGLGIYDHSFPNVEELEGPFLLNDISEDTGGRTFTLDNPNDLANAAAQIGTELRNQYVLSYRPAPPRLDGKWHKITVKLILPEGLPRLMVRAKRGYYAPLE